MVGGRAMVRYRKKFSDFAFDAIIYIIITIICLICLYPMLYVFFASISDGSRLYRHVGPIYYPLGFSLQGYRIVLSNPGVWSGYKNTIFYVIGGTAFSMLMTTLGAYVLSRKGYKLKKFFMLFIVFTMYFNGGMIPTFLLVRSLGLLNSRLAIMIVGSVGTWNMIIMRTAFQSIPRSLEESAIIDGANDFAILTKIILPTSKATLAVITLFYAVGQWNSWFNPMIYLQSRDKYPLQLLLREILIMGSKVEGGAEVQSGIGINYLGETIKYTTIIVSTLPILFVYPFAQKYFVKGIMMGSLKE
jgi:putative aldouronate transport system permease protein